MRQPATVGRLESQGDKVDTGAVGDFAKFMAESDRYWKALITEPGIQL